MSNQILTTLKNKLEEISNSYGDTGVEIQRNALKEVLQYYVLNFIYHHREYKNWIMYGGSALRICHGLDRMSVDLDFEVETKVTTEFLEKLTHEIANYFEKEYNITHDMLTIGMTHNRGLTLKFHIAQELGLPVHSKQVHVKIDLNYFDIHPKIVTENWPQNEYQLSFAIKTYNMSALMASKIVAIFLRGQRGVGETIYQEKGRDIYDLLWYMKKRVTPDLDYLKAKAVEEARDFRTLFDRLTIKILHNPKTDENLIQDLLPLFGNQTFIENWIQNWRQSYMKLLEEYKIHTITKLQEIKVFQDFNTDIFSFIYWYSTDNHNQAIITYEISDYWIKFKDGDLSIETSTHIKNLFEFNRNGIPSHPPSEEKLMRYAELFYQKSEKYLESTKYVMLGDTITTKVIRMTADNLNPKEQILLNKSALISCELDDLLK